MGTLKRIANALEAINGHLDILIWKMERIAVALEPTPKPLAKETKKEAEPMPVITKEEPKPLLYKVEPTTPRCKYEGYYGLQNFRKYGIKEGEAANYLRKRGIAVYRINGHQYCEKKYFKTILNDINQR